jgi:glc operon protein GlcG
MMLKSMLLELKEAKAMADAAEAKAIELSVKIAIVVMDQHGNLKYFRRMDGNNAVSLEMAPLKAKTSSLIPISTKELAKRNAALENKPYLAVPGIVLLEGGLPIFSPEGEHIGSIGISGASPEIDGECAAAALTAFQGLS